MSLPPVSPPAPRIRGVLVRPLRVIPDERGRVMEILRRADPLFERFGQAYLTTVYPGVVKAWHMHRHQADNIAVLRGMLRIGLYDGREDSPTRGLVDTFYAGEHQPLLVHVPAGVFHGFKGIGTEEALVVNLPTAPYDYARPDEIRRPPDDPGIPYDWRRRDG